MSSRPPCASMAVGNSENALSSAAGKDSSGIIHPDENTMAKNMINTPKRCRTELFVARVRENARFSTSRVRRRMKNRNPTMGKSGRNNPLRN